MITVRKLKLSIVNDDVELRNTQYQFIRDSQYAQYLGLNRAMSHVSTAYLSGDKERFKEAKKELTNTAAFFQDISFGVGIDSKSSITQKVKKDIQSDLKNGLVKGERSVRNYKRSFPLITRGRDLRFYYEGEEVCIKWVNKIIFKVVIGRKDKDYQELMHTLNKVVSGEYKVGQSSVAFNNKDLILNLTLDIPVTIGYEAVPGRILGVDLGINIPAYISLNDIPYIKKALGSKEEFIKVRMQMQRRRQRIQKQLQLAKGGKGRKDKLAVLDRLRTNERKFVKTYNHMLSKRIVEFAIKNQCESIHMERLAKDNFGEKLLANWSYYELQNMVEYKAKTENIKVKYVDPRFTSQRCSKCGHTERDNRETQEQFICKSCRFKANADYNASQNIARSTSFM